MIYFDNSATSRPKPDCVYDAFNYYVREIGTSPGRGSYNLAIQASRMLYQSRKTVGLFFGAPNPRNVVFTKNSTEAINLLFNGLLKTGDHVLISPFEHNAVLRPLHCLKEKGVIDYSVLPEAAIYGDEDIGKYVNRNTVLIALTLASNLTGQIIFSHRIAEQAKKLGLRVFVDASQGAGKKLINMKDDFIDYVAFTGHKDLLALPGVGGLISSEALTIEPLIQGGTGIHGENYINPDIYPEAYESGTLNMPAIWALKTAIDYINENISEIHSKETEIIDYLISELSKLPSVTIYRKDAKRVPTFCFNIDGIKSSNVVERLSDLDICVRGGIHCAIKGHETLNTVETGVVRVSINQYNSLDEADIFIRSIKEIIDESSVL